MDINNFDIIRSHLTFEKARKFNPNTGNIETINDTYDRYIVHIIKRAKDATGKKYGVNESNRLIKTYEISSLEYFDKKKDHIIDLCKSNGARAYILPQVRSTYDCLKEMIKLGIDNLENPTIKFQHILRSALCSMHKSRDKKWILDLDDDCMTEYDNVATSKKGSVIKKTWTVDEVLKLVQDCLVECCKKPEDAYVVRTKSGHHVITRPFDLQKAYKKCSMLYEGVQKKIVDIKYTGPGESEDIVRDVTGWLHKDGMTLLYVPEIN